MVDGMNESPLNQFVSDVGSHFQRGDDTVGEKLAERQNVERVQAIYAAIGNGDIEAFKDSLADDVEFEIVGPEDVPFSGRANGKEQSIELVRGNFALLEKQEPVVVDVVAQGDSVVVNGCERGRLRGAQSDYAMEWVQRFRFQAGQVTSFRQVFAVAATKGDQ